MKNIAHKDTVYEIDRAVDCRSRSEFISVVTFMGLEDVLRQNAEIRDFLSQLVVVHERALREPELSSQLEKIRKDILVCFNDLCKLNEMLISCDGEIREEIELLKRSKKKFEKLGRRERLLTAEKAKWTASESVGLLADLTDESHSVTVSASYRPLLDKYIELVGAQNTTLALDEFHTAEDEEEPKKIMQSIQILNECRERSSRDIQRLEQLLKSFSNDQQFVAKEIKAQSAKIRRHSDSLEEEIRSISHSREKLLIEIGLISPELQTSSLSQKFFNLNFSKGNEDKLKAEVSDITGHAIEFIDMKIMSLQDQLTHKKEDSSNLTQQRNIWSDCVQCVNNLESDLSLALSEELDFATSSIKIIGWLKEAIKFLDNLRISTNNEYLLKLIRDEKEVIEKAYNEISVGDKTVTMSNINSEAKSPPKRHASPPFAVMSKSPPKIGISEQVVGVASGDHGHELKMKSQKKD